MKYYEILSNGYIGATTKVPDGTLAIPAGNTRTAPPATASGEYLIWSGSGWSVTHTPPTSVQPAQDREALKLQRDALVSEIKVTTAAGNTFDGDEQSQTRMTRAIVALSTGLAPSVTWILADNTTIQATAAELTEALVLAGQAQAAIWVI